MFSPRAPKGDELNRAVKRIEHVTAGDQSQSGPTVDDLAAEQAAGQKRKKRKKKRDVLNEDKIDLEIKGLIQSLGGDYLCLKYAETRALRIIYAMYTSAAKSVFQRMLARYLAKCIWEMEELEKSAMDIGYDLVRHCSVYDLLFTCITGKS